MILHKKRILQIHILKINSYSIEKNYNMILKFSSCQRSRDKSRDLKT